MAVFSDKYFNIDPAQLSTARALYQQAAALLDRQTFFKRIQDREIVESRRQKLDMFLGCAGFAYRQTTLVNLPLAAAPAE